VKEKEAREGTTGMKKEEIDKLEGFGVGGI
jgi:hypothetical protein